MEDKVKLLQELKSIEDRIVPVLNKQDEEVKRLGGTSTQTAAALSALESKHDKVELEIKQLSDALAKSQEKKSTYSGPKRVGTEFLQGNESFKQMVKSKGNRSEASDLGSLSNYQGWEQKGLAGNDQLRNVLGIDLLPTIYADPLRPNRVRDLFNVVPTTAGIIEFVRENVLNINAAMVAESGQKPESNIGFVDATTPIRTLAHWMPVARQILDDTRSLESYLNNRLMQGLKMIEDYQILYGDGTGANLQGILTTPGIQNYAWSSGKTNDTQIDAIRRAITLAELAYYPVTGMVMHPSLWEQIELTKSTTNLYVWVNIADGGIPRLWKVPVVTTTAINTTDVLLGAFRDGACVWDRESANLRVSDSHGNLFTQNMVAFLMEERIGLSVFRPKSFILANMDAAPP
jgi:HK97 family phage major capsid protein